MDVIVCNDDFTDRRTDVKWLCRKHDPLAVLTQESKRTDYRKELGKKWGVRQKLSNDSTAGVAVIWDSKKARAVGHYVNRPMRLGWGYEELTRGRASHNGQPGILGRGIVWQDLMVKNRLLVRMASTHRPPSRDSDLWPEFDLNLTRWMNKARISIFVGMDANEVGGPGGVAIATGARWRGQGIDGALTDLLLRGDSRRLRKRRSDHHAVLLPIKLGSDHAGI